ncbi:MAG: NAD(P)-dependent glycerol-3-phosphate dehydrogenase [Firmicutes bacterium]|nr:NAD(P)-dependent glycerol-3-phosphate dehydrogenase [Dethiobacter sp.]MBS3889364.1 NAD(P)-dependent glycerol-3-phosphate dehydrogenase [Bacillota bacterium]MBS4055306.1 NAD(P)-dependent glycerol-3-phosphate dehydrogenase [Thermaerobacter sp.]
MDNRQRRIGIVGAGGWGTALAKVAAHNSRSVHLWVREAKLREEIALHGRNELYLPGVQLPDNIVPVSDFATFADCELVIMATPSQYVGTTAQMLKPHLKPGTIIVNAAKGFDLISGTRLSVLLGDTLGLDFPLAVISGPNHALEIAKGLPAASVAAANHRAVAAMVQDALMTDFFRIYTNVDMVGVELGGALKNIYALAAGIAEGLGYGDNTKAALMTRGLTEMVRLGKAMGAHPATFAGLSGMGDLIVTCTSQHSRNRRTGLALGQGQSLHSVLQSTTQVVEGVNATRAADRLSKEYGVELPIARALHEVLFMERDPREAVHELMTRHRKTESEEQLPFEAH